VPPQWVEFLLVRRVNFRDAKDAPLGVFTLDWSLVHLLVSGYFYRNIGSEDS
jgi:hypothetical protein